MESGAGTRLQHCGIEIQIIATKLLLASHSQNPLVVPIRERISRRLAKKCKFEQQTLASLFPPPPLGEMAPLLVQLLTPSSTPLTAFLDPTASLSELLEKILAEDAQLVTSFTGLPRAEVRGDDWGVRRVARSERGRVWRAEEMEGVRRESELFLVQSANSR